MFKFSVDFQFDVFKFLFSRKGKAHERGMGMRVYEKEDFDTEFFSNGWDVTYDGLGNGCCMYRLSNYYEASSQVWTQVLH